MNEWRRTASTLIVFMVFAASAYAATPVRVALVMAQPGRDAEKSLLLAEAELTNDADIVLLDRQHIRSVLREQRLDAQGLLAADRVLQLGKLLTAELLAVVEPDSRGGSGAGGLVVYHASSGLRLWDSALSGGGIEQCAQGICQAVRSAVGKLQAEDQDAVSVCILQLRNAELPGLWDSRIQTLGKLLERHFVQMPNVAVLEREHLEFAAGERRLPSAEPLASLLASHVFLSIDAERGDGGQGVALVARLSDEARNDLATLSVSSGSGDVAELAGRLAEAIAEHLGKAPPATRFDRKAEARRFMFESNYEAAYVLNPEEPLYRRRYITLLSTNAYPGIPQYVGGLVRSRRPFEKEALQRSLTYLQQSLDLIDEELDFVMSSNQSPESPRDVPAGQLSHWLRRGMPAMEFMSTESRRKFEDIVRRYRVCQEAWGDRLFANAESQDVHSAVNRWALCYLVDLQYVEVFLGEGDDSPLADWTARWVELLDRHPLDKDEQRLSEVARVLPSLHFHQTSKLIFWSNDRDRLRPGYERLATSQSRFLRCYGRMLLVDLDRGARGDRHIRAPFLSRSVDESSDRRLQALIDESIAEMTRENVPNGIRKAWTGLLDRLVRGLSAEVYVPIVGKALERLWANDVYGGQLPYDLMNRQRHAKDYDAALQTIDRALAKLEDGKTEMDSFECSQEADRLIAQRKFILRQAGRDVASGAPWKSVKTLFECVAPEKYSGIRYQEEKFRAIARPVVTGRDVYFLAFQFSGTGDRANLVLMRRSLDGESADELGAFRVRRRYLYEKAPPNEPRRVLENSSPVIDSPAGSSSVVDAVIAHGRYYAATQGYGIVVFPLDASEPWAIDASDGMPLDVVRRLVVYGDDIYSWLSRDGSSHSYFVRISREGKVAEVICSSQRSTPKNILDGHRPTVCYFMTLDAAKERLVFGLNSPGCLEHRAIFQFDLPTQTFSKLVDCVRNMSFDTGLHYGNSVLIWGGQSPVGPDGAPRSGNCTPVLLSFDLATDALTEVLPDKLRAGSPKIILVRDKHFWTSNPFGRIDRETGTFEQLPPLRQWEFGILATAIKIDEERVLLHDSQSLWLTVLPEEAAE